MSQQEHSSSGTPYCTLPPGDHCVHVTVPMGLTSSGQPSPSMCSALGPLAGLRMRRTGLCLYSPPRSQSLLALLALAMFSCRFCFFFCSRSRASIILASFQDNRALAMKSGVRARMTVVRKPYGSLAAHSTTYSAQARKSIIPLADQSLAHLKEKQRSYYSPQVQVFW